MKLSERLKKNNDKIVASAIKNSGFSVKDIFIDSQFVRKYISDLAINKRNIIFVGSKSFDKIIIANYIFSLLEKTNAKVIEDINDNSNDFHGRINIVPNPDINNIVKILEQTIYGCQSFIFGLNLGTYDNIIHKLKVLIALNYRNLSPIDINTLIGAMNAVIIYISNLDDGMFYISKADEIKYNKTETDLELVNLLSEEDVKKYQSQELKKQVKKSEQKIKEPVSAPVENEVKEIKKIIVEKEVEVNATEKKKENKVEVKPEVEKKELQQIKEPKEGQNQPKIDLVQAQKEPEQKLNKYQILKEKIKKKKLEEINQKV